MLHDEHLGRTPGATVRFPATAQLAAADVPRASTTSGASDVPTLVAGDNAFAFDLYRGSPSGDHANVVFSPASISNAISMLEGGARGETLHQIDATLHFTLPSARLHDAFNALDQMLAAPRHAGTGRRARRSSSSRPTRFGASAATRSCARTSTCWPATTAREFGSPTSSMHAEAERVQDQRVRRAARRTAASSELFPAGVIDSLTRMVLVNTIWFKGDWVRPFSTALGSTDLHATRRQHGGNVQLMHGGHASRAITSSRLRGR